MEEKEERGKCESEEKSIPKKMLPNEKLLSISDGYLSDLECLREMFVIVLPMLKEKDNERTKIISKIVQNAKIENKLKEKKDISNEKSATKGQLNLTFNSSDLEIVFSNIRKLNRAEKLFKQQLTVSLISRFDEFLGSLLKIVLHVHPEWLKASEKTITYRELVNLQSIEKAIDGLIHKEVENLLRGSHDDQIKFIDDKLKLGINKSFTRLPEFLELTERRNLCVHTGGRVSQQYLDQCEIFGFKNNDSINVGSSLDIDEEYFNNAFALCFELGLRISQSSYRRLFPDILENADKALNHLEIKFPNSGDYNLAEVLCDFDLSIPEKFRSPDVEFIYFARINRAIAQKFSGKEFESGLQGVHWKAFHPKYELALDVLKGNYDKAGETMKSETIQDSIGKMGFRSWPLFKEFRNTEYFKKSYLEIYKEEYIPDPEKDLEDGSFAEGFVLAENNNNCSKVELTHLFEFSCKKGINPQKFSGFKKLYSIISVG